MCAPVGEAEAVQFLPDIAPQFDDQNQIPQLEGLKQSTSLQGVPVDISLGFNATTIPTEVAPLSGWQLIGTAIVPDYRTNEFSAKIIRQMGGTAATLW